MDKRTWCKYFHEAKKHLHCNTAHRKAFQQKNLAAVEDIKGENPNISDLECLEIIGTPEEAAQSFLAGFPQELIQNEMKKQKKKRWIAMIGGVILTVFLACVIAFLFVKEFTVVEVDTTIIDWDSSNAKEAPNLLN